MNRRAPKSERASCNNPPAAQAVIVEIFEALTREVANNTRAITELSMEVHALRRERLSDAPAAIEELCSAIHNVFGEEHFGAKWIVEVMSDPDQTSVRLTNAVERLLGPKPSGKKLSHFLTRSIGAFGPWRLMFHQEGSRDGNLFRVTDTT
jgi:hypothetical protein